MNNDPLMYEVIAPIAPLEVIEPIVVPTPLVADRRFGFGKRVTTAVFAGTMLLAACGSDSKGITLSTAAAGTTIGTEGATTSSSIDAATTSSIAPNIDGAPVVMSDQDLASGKFHCGENVPGNTDLSFKLDLFSSSEANKTLGQSMIDVTATDKTWGMTQEGFDFMLSHAANNSATVKSREDAKKTSGNPVLDQYNDKLVVVPIAEDMTFVNGDCRHGDKVMLPSPDVPLVTLQAGGTVEGVMMSDADLEAWHAILLKNGQENTFAELKVPGVTGDDGTVYDNVIVTELNGCGNPARKTKTPPPTTVVSTPPTMPTITVTVPTTTPHSTTTTTTVPGSTTTSTPETVPPTTPPTTEYIPPKAAVPPVGPNTTPGAGGSPGGDVPPSTNASGYGSGEVVPTAPPQPGNTVTATTADTVPATTGVRTPSSTTTIADGTNGTPETPITGNPGAPA